MSADTASSQKAEADPKAKGQEPEKEGPLTPGSRVTTAYGAATVVKIRPEDNVHEVALDWKMAGDERVMAYLNPESVRRRRISDMTVSEMVQHSAKLKRVGNELIKQGNKFGEALQLYQAAFVVMQQAVRRISEAGIVLAKETASRINALIAETLNNAALCQYKMGQYKAVVGTSTLLLKSDPTNISALLRRGLALVELSAFGQAEKDFALVCKQDPKDTVAASLLETTRRRAKQERQRESEKLSGFLLSKEERAAKRAKAKGKGSAEAEDGAPAATQAEQQGAGSAVQSSEDSGSWGYLLAVGTVAAVATGALLAATRKR